MTNNIDLKKYFYKQVHDHYVSTKNYLKLARNAKRIQDKVDELEVLKPEGTEGDDQITTQAEEEDDSNEPVPNFQKLDQNKWILSTGKCGEHELFIFALQCQEDHPSKSYIIDTADLNYTFYNVFTEEELNEIRTHEEKDVLMPPHDVLKHMDKFNLNTTNQLRKALKGNHTFQDKPNDDYDWINFTIYSLLREYESGNMQRSHSETWYKPISGECSKLVSINLRD